MMFLWSLPFHIKHWIFYLLFPIIKLDELLLWWEWMDSEHWWKCQTTSIDIVIVISLYTIVHLVYLDSPNVPPQLLKHEQIVWIFDSFYPMIQKVIYWKWTCFSHPLSHIWNLKFWPYSFLLDVNHSHCMMVVCSTLCIFQCSFWSKSHLFCKITDHHIPI